MKTRNLLISMVIPSAMLCSAVVAAEPQAAAATAVQSVEKERMICRTEKETGSLVKRKKTCHTKSQWQYIDDTNQSFANRLVDDTRSKSGSN